MNNELGPPEDDAELRQPAEQQIAEEHISAYKLFEEQQATAGKLADEQRSTAGKLANDQRAAMLKLLDEQETSAKKQVHELQVFQVQLEMQNEALREARGIAEMALERYAELFDFAPVAYFILEPDGTIKQSNLSAGLLFGVVRSKLSGQCFDLSVSSEHRPFFRLFLEDVFAGDGKQQCEISLQVGGKTIWTAIHAAADANRQTCLVAALDITERKKSEAIISHQANFDLLTGLPNRRLLLDRLQVGIKKSRRTGQKLALMFLDLDHFKDINDSLGHDMGDMLLKETTRRLQACIRETDTLARPSGDEFIIVLGELENEQRSIDRVAQCILSCMIKPFQLKAEHCYVSFSIGIALYPEDATDLDDLLKKADQAMYAAKNQGRNRYCYFTPAMQQAAESRLRLVNELHSALANHQFWMAYQPIVELATGDIHKAEALIRWHHPTRELVTPTEFIPVAEETGMIIELGEWVFHQAAKQVEKWRAHGHPLFQISVNKSPAQFRNNGKSHEDWLEHLHGLGLPGCCIVVEITEGLLMDASPLIAEKLLAFRDAGMQVSLDDFGTGYSSLSYLKKFHIDYLKIDQAFVGNLTTDPTDLTLCEAIILMAHKLGMKVIGEGIETREQRDLLLQAGCDYGQGYLFSRPVSAEEFEKLF